jgi:hypothetical protein
MTGPPKPRVGRLQIRMDRVIYTTITMMPVLIIYDGWTTLRFWGVVAIVLEPILAIFLSDVFGEELGTRVALGRPLTRSERSALIVEESRFLLVPIPPLIILTVLGARRRLLHPHHQRDRPGRSALARVLGAVAGRRAGLTGWSLAVSTLSGLGVGCVILVLQALLQPGHDPFVP